MFYWMLYIICSDSQQGKFCSLLANETTIFILLSFTMKNIVFHITVSL